MSNDNNHRFLELTNEKPFSIETNRLAAYILNTAFKTTHSISKLKKIKDIQFEVLEKNQVKKGSISLEKLSEYLYLHRHFQVEFFNFPKIECDWLDGLVGIAKPDGPIATLSRDKFAAFSLPMPFGSRFPLAPCIDREGAAYRSLQSPLQKNIIRLYKKLVENSFLVATLDFTWLNDFRMLLNDCVSIVDVTLHQLYFMAQYGNQSDKYLFNEESLGSRHKTRLEDKLKWISKITGRGLDNAQKEIKSFKIIKNLRNHLNHFDPPCFAYTVEDIVLWLNLVPDVGRLLWRIREKLQVQLNSTIIEMILLPPIAFVPYEKGSRVRQPSNVGYGSTDWSNVSPI